MYIWLLILVENLTHIAPLLTELSDTVDLLWTVQGIIICKVEVMDLRSVTPYR